MIEDKILILNRIKDYKNFKSDKELADFLDISTQNLSNWKTRNTLDYDIIITKCLDIDLTWLLTGKGEMILKNENEIIEKNNLLKEIESLDKEDQERIFHMLEVYIKDAKARQQK